MSRSSATGAGGQQGVYRSSRRIRPSRQIRSRVADLNTAIPGGTGNFTGFAGAPDISGEAVAFLGTGAGGQQGVYSDKPGRIRAGSPTSYADPERHGNFTGIHPADPSISLNDSSSSGDGSGGQQGVTR